MKKILCIIAVFLALQFLTAADLTGQKAALFSANDLNGQQINLADYRGKIVLLDFWASWCGPCKQEFPFLVNLYEKHKKDDFIVLAVNIDNEKKNMLHFLLKNDGIKSFPVIFDPDKKIPPLYDLQAMPTSLFIDKKGIIRFVHSGFNNSSKKIFHEELTTLLNEKKE
jgi:thiol-disulfide isomerase/thioredoxin